MRYEIRLSKYDPAKRDSTGAFSQDDWTMYQQIGAIVAGRRLTRRDYQRTEDRYIAAILEMIREVGISKVRINRVSAVNRGKVRSLPKKNDYVSLVQLERLSRWALKGELDVSFTLPRQFYLHFGFDYLVYIGLPRRPDVSISRLARKGLFVEEMRSPYLPHA
jgi:hypothetical protein